MSEEKFTVKKSFFMKWPIVVLTGVIAVIALLAAFYFYQQYRKSKELLQNPTLAAQMQTQNLINTVGKLYSLPNDETPTIATVSDVTKLSGQSFFKKAQNGDKVLIYSKNRLVILYDPSQNIVLNVAPINVANNVSSSTPTPSVKGAKTLLLKR